MEGVPLADTNRSMEQFLSGLPEQERPCSVTHGILIPRYMRRHLSF
ncbi:MAG: hypothetical protein ACLRXC_12335 [[Clostridium] leptum]